jgi:hypothetical protein
MRKYSTKLNFINIFASPDNVIASFLQISDTCSKIAYEY